MKTEERIIYARHMRPRRQIGAARLAQVLIVAAALGMLLGVVWN